MSEQQAKSSTFEELYLQQRKKSSVLLIAAVVLALSTVGSLAWGFSKDSDSSNTADGQTSFQNGNGFQGRGGLGGQMGFKVEQFFNDDGSINNDEVSSFMERTPSGMADNFLDRFVERINQAADDGDITKDQAEALINALETESSANET